MSVARTSHNGQKKTAKGASITNTHMIVALVLSEFALTATSMNQRTSHRRTVRGVSAMTKEEAKANQDRIAKNFKLSWWYGTNCEKCCEVYPKFDTEGDSAGGRCFYICEVCGKRTSGFSMPWLAERAWNNHEYKQNQISWF